MSRTERGFSLVEGLVCMALMGLLLLAVDVATSSSMRVVRNVSGAQSSTRELRKAEMRLMRDFDDASPDCLEVASSATTYGVSKDGDALWFLSDRDASGTVRHKEDGTPFWQRNILYYLVVPTDQLGMFGADYAGAPGPDGYDDRCPHKLLIRKVINKPPVDLTDEDTEAELIDNINPYLDRPTGWNVSGLGGPGVEKVEVVAGPLLWFRALPNGQRLDIDLRAVSEVDARKSLRLGVDPLATGRFTTQHLFSLFPPN